MLTPIENDLLIWATSEGMFCSQGLCFRALALLPPMKTSETEIVRKKASQLIQKWKKSGLIQKANELGHPYWIII